MLQTGIKLYLQLYFTSALLLIFIRCSIKVTWQKSRQSHLPVFWKFSLQNLGKSSKSLHTTCEWINSNCHRLFSLCHPFHFCWKWGVHHSPTFPYWKIYRFPDGQAAHTKTKMRKKMKRFLRRNERNYRKMRKNWENELTLPNQEWEAGYGPASGVHKLVNI